MEAPAQLRRDTVDRHHRPELRILRGVVGEIRQHWFAPFAVSLQEKLRIPDRLTALGDVLALRL